MLEWMIHTKTGDKVSEEPETLPENVTLIQFAHSGQVGDLSILAFPNHEERNRELSRSQKEGDPRDRFSGLDVIELDLQSDERYVAMCLDDDMFEDYKTLLPLHQLLIRAYSRGLTKEPFDLNLSALMSCCGRMYNAVIRYFPGAAKGLSQLLGRIHKLGMNSSFSLPEKDDSP